MSFAKVVGPLALAAQMLVFPGRDVSPTSVTLPKSPYAGMSSAELKAMCGIELTSCPGVSYVTARQIDPKHPDLRLGSWSDSGTSKLNFTQRGAQVPSTGEVLPTHEYVTAGRSNLSAKQLGSKMTITGEVLDGNDPTGTVGSSHYHFPESGRSRSTLTFQQLRHAKPAP